jgi:NAD(P)-dependent dehydrogenase (short-subunit alcohol dehydrogenase family)
MSDMFTLITGASSGMGEATARLLSQDRNLILHGRNEERLATVGQACAANGHKVVLFPYDLEKADGVAEALTAFLKERGLPIEALAHFAGLTEVLPISKTIYKIGLQVMNVNYFSITEIISTLLKRKVNGHNLDRILLTSSIVVTTGKKYQPHYCASKGALNALTTALACELAPRVRVNTIAPGSFKTRIIETLFADVGPETEWAPATLLPPGTVEDLAKVARFLLSDESRYLTGQIIDVDGGEHFPKL